MPFSVPPFGSSVSSLQQATKSGQVHAARLAKEGHKALSQHGQTVLKLSKAPIGQLGLGTLFKVGIPVVASVFPLFDVPLLGWLPKILIGRYSIRLGQNTLKTLSGKQLQGSLKHFHQLAKHDLATLFSDKAHFRKFVLHLNLLNKTLIQEAPVMKGAQTLAKRLPLNPKHWGFLKKLPLVGKTLGAAAYEKIKTLHTVRHLPEAQFRREVYRQLVRLNPSSKTGELLQFALDANTPDLQLMAEASKAPTLLHAVWGATVGNFGKTVNELITKGPMKALKLAANRFSFLKPFAMGLQALRFIPKGRSV